MLSKKTSRICRHRPLMRYIPQRKRQSPACPTSSVAWCRNSSPDSRDAWKSRNSIRQNIADKRMELQKAQEARQAQRKADGSATTGATRPHERPATASTIPKPSAEKTQEVKRPATATTSKASEPVKTNVIKERPLSSGASDRKATQPTQPVHRQNVEKVVSQETRQNYTKDRRTKVQQTQNRPKEPADHRENP